ncbi:hypothetical protein JK628_03070 [Shewanella sp. KX20019]|uniref:hypothetical protein n=1 Tax=Shewanella sp. KX20019 TaxID=2803864 RepID=UPI001925D083|nr:hypothetical protein [Shewanella sp. KX20019]QQX80872.1 hypothetical protein JK628_03070 [Shewanella sp. KX20019]
MARKRITAYLDPRFHKDEIEYINNSNRQTDAIINLVSMGYMLERVGLGKIIMALKSAGYTDKKALIAAINFDSSDNAVEKKPEQKVNSFPAQAIKSDIKIENKNLVKAKAPSWG